MELTKLKIPRFLISHFRTNHAGETGAVYIYKGILLVSKDADIIKFATEHQNTELSHLEKIEMILPVEEKSKLIFLWKLFGFLTGFIPALLGKKFIYTTIFFVESFVERHYQDQLNLLSKSKENKEIKKLIKELTHDEVKHKDEAANKLKQMHRFHLMWGKVVEFGSVVAVWVSKKI